MADRVYEMYDDYYEAQAQLLELIEARELLAASLKTAHPSRLKEGQKLLAAADKKIEACEAALAKEYDAHQATEKAREAYEQKMSELEESFDAAMEYLSTAHPEVHKRLLAQFNNEES